MRLGSMLLVKLAPTPRPAADFATTFQAVPCGSAVAAETPSLNWLCWYGHSIADYVDPASAAFGTAAAASGAKLHNMLIQPLLLLHIIRKLPGFCSCCFRCRGRKVGEAPDATADGAAEAQKDLRRRELPVGRNNCAAVPRLQQKRPVFQER